MWLTPKDTIEQAIYDKNSIIKKLKLVHPKISLYHKDKGYIKSHYARKAYSSKYEFLIEYRKYDRNSSRQYEKEDYIYYFPFYKNIGSVCLRYVWNYIL